MTKSQNTKNEQQKDLCITSEHLTEKWKKGELPNGWYWVKGIKSEGIYAYTAEYLNNMYRPRNGEIIIEQVPSYEEWQASYNCMLENEVLRLKNAQLKELLKECIPYFNALVEKRLKLEYIPQVYELLTKINEVLK